MFSGLFGAVPVVLLKQLQRRTFIFNQEKDQSRKRRMLRLWARLDAVFWILVVLYVMFCIFFLFCFVANVNSSTEVSWLTSTVTALTKEVLVSPMLLAAFHVVALTAYVAKAKHVSDMH